jgi:hypothetical protein
VIDHDALEDVLDRLSDTPGQLRALIDDVDDTDLRRAAAGGGWGPVEIFCHLRDLDALFIERVERMLAEDEPALPVVDETLWPIERDYAAQDPRAALAQFAANRERFVRVLCGLDAAAWSRRGHHPEWGEQTVIWYAEHAAEHDAVHAQQLRELVGARR